MKAPAADPHVLRVARSWLKAGDSVWLVTVLETSGPLSSPVGSVAVVNGRGEIFGSVADGRIEYELVEGLRRGHLACERGRELHLGATPEPPQPGRCAAPCRIRLWLEPAAAALLGSSHGR